MGLQRYLDCVLKHKGHALYESEVHPSIVSALMGNVVKCRSYLMPSRIYANWIKQTGMDMLYAYIPWPVGRNSKIDTWGVVNWEDGYWTAADLRKDPPYDTIRRRLDELCSLKDGFGIEVAVYSAPMLLQNGLGLEKFLLMGYDNPDLLTSWLDALTAKVSLELELVMEYPVDAVQISQILADKNGQICNDDQLERFNLQYLRRHVQHIRARGKVATLHCDGKLDKLYPRLIDLGVQCINGYDSNKFTVDLREWGKKVGMRGSISMDALYRMTPEQMKVEVRTAKLMPSHVISSTHNFPEVNPKLFLAMVEEFAK